MENGLRFEWNFEKARQNLKKHNVDFAEAATVFQDENAVLFDDPEHSSEEDRFLIIGFSKKLRILLVSHCVRNEDVIRIISAREATKNEKRQYSEFNNC